MELCWYKTSWTSGCLWLDNMQQTLIGDLFFFSPPLRGMEKKQESCLFCIINLPSSKDRALKPTTAQVEFCTLHTAHDKLWLVRWVVLESGAHLWEQQVSNSGTPPVPEALSGSWARSYMLALYRQNVTQTCPLSSSFVVLFTFIFSWYFL